MFRKLLGFILGSGLLASPAGATPTVKVTPTTKSVEKGGSFQIRLELSTAEPLKDILIAPIMPEGFTAEPMSVHPDLVSWVALRLEPEQKILKKEESVEQGMKIASLEAGSAITVSFKVWPPGLLGGPRKGAMGGFYKAREPQPFVFNVFYVGGKDPTPVKGALTVSTEVRYTTAIGYYFFFGLVGLLLGHVIKVSTKNRVEIQNLTSPKRLREKIGIVIGYIFGDRLTDLLTLSVIGLGVLIYLAQDGVPVNHWHQAVAMGVGLGILTDEQLLTKIK